MVSNLLPAIQGFKVYLAEEYSSEETRKLYRYLVQKMQRYLRTKNITGVSAIDATCILGYIRSEEIRRLAKNTKKKVVTVLRRFMGYCEEHGLILSNPFERMSIKITGEEKERPVFTEEEMQEFLDIIPLTGFIHVRNKSIFELMYGTGIRVNEVTQLNREDISVDQKEVKIMKGKGGKQRIVPLCGKALDAMKLWLNYYRIDAPDRDSHAVYVNRNGERIQKRIIQRAFHEYFEKTGNERKKLVPHSIRHSCATHLLAHGADIRYIQELLGHSSIETTAQYTKQEKTRLKTIHKRFHPKENELYEEV